MYNNNKDFLYFKKKVQKFKYGYSLSVTYKYTLHTHIKNSS